MLSDSQVARITSVAGPPLLGNRPDLRFDGERAADLQTLLEARNGFYAFESALHVLPSDSSDRDGRGQPACAEFWNAPSTWKQAFDGMADGFWFFAEDVFGVQFAVHEDSVVSFDPESGDVQHIAADTGGWIDAVMNEYQLLTGYTLAHAWQQQYGPLHAGKRLLPKIPFALGGHYDVSNLFEEDAVQGMHVRGSLAVQIRDLPDGTQVEYRVVP